MSFHTSRDRDGAFDLDLKLETKPDIRGPLVPSPFIF